MDFPRIWRLLRLALSVVLAGCVAIFLATSLHWRLVGDQGQMMYSVFLVAKGMSPYQTVLDTNQPGTFLLYSAFWHMFGASDLAWRLFDLFWLAIAGCAMFFLARPRIPHPYGWFAGAMATGMFVLIHAHGGDEQMGQRDLIIAVLLLAAYAFLFHAMRQRTTWPLFFFALCASYAGTIKPPAFAFMLALLLLAALWSRALNRPVLPAVLACVAGAAIPVAIVAGYLAIHGSVPGYIYMVRTVLPFYAQMARMGLLAMLQTSKVIPLLELFAGLAAAIALLRRDWSWETVLLAFGAVYGLAHYLFQGRGFAYHRYPLVAFVVLWASIQFSEGIRRPGIVRGLSLAGLVAALVAAPLLTLHAVRKPEWGRPYRTALRGELESLGGSQLSGHVQCLATNGDCNLVLLDMKLTQSTGLMYDYMVFGDDSQPAMQQLRQRTWQQMQQNPPQIFVVDPYVFPEHPCSGKPLAGVGLPGAEQAEDAYAGAKYAKLKTWPQMDQLLAQHYTLVQDNALPEDNAPCKFTMGYRVYVKK